MKWLAAALVMVSAVAVAAADPLAEIVKTAPGCDAARAHCFGIQFHVAPGADEGSLVVTPEWLAEQVAQAEKHFTALDTGFDVVGADVLVDKRTAHLETRKDRDALATTTGLGGKVIHVYITGKLDDVDIAGSIAYGVTWHTTDERKFIIVSGMALSRTLAHELGHFFGLPHSTYAISIMNKTERKEPPREQRTFADAEIDAMKPVLARLVHDGVIAERKKPTK